MTGPWRWLLCSAALAIGAAVAVSSAGCSGCDSPPPDSCFAPPGAGHQEACASCGSYYTGCLDGKWVMIPCGAVTPPVRDGGR